MKKVFIFIILIISICFAQHSDRLFAEKNSANKHDAELYYNGNQIFSEEPYDAALILQNRNGGGYHLIIFASDFMWHRIIFSRMPVDVNGNQISTSSWTKGFGSFGPGNNQFKGPHGIAAARYDTRNIDVYVADTGNNRIVKLRIDAETGNVTWVTTFNASSVGGFNQPYDVAVQTWMTYPGEADGGPPNPNDDQLFVVDRNNNRLVILNANSGSVVRTYGTYGSGTGQFNSPVSISIARYWSLQEYDVFLSDRGNNRIVALDGAQLIWTGNPQFWSTYQFSSHTNITTVETDQNQIGCYAVDRDNHKIYKLINWQDGGSLGFAAEYGNMGTGQFQLYYPNSISVPVGLVINNKVCGMGVGGIVEKWTDNSGAQWVWEGVDILNLTANVNSAGSIMNYNYKTPAVLGYPKEVIKNSSGVIVQTLKDGNSQVFTDQINGNWSLGTNPPGLYTFTVTYGHNIKYDDGTYLDVITKSISFYMYPALTASISGPAFVYQNWSTLYNASVSGGSGNFSYQWYSRNNGISTWTTLGTGSSQTITNPSVGLTLRLDVRDNITSQTVSTNKILAWYPEFIVTITSAPSGGNTIYTANSVGGAGGYNGYVWEARNYTPPKPGKPNGSWGNWGTQTQFNSSQTMTLVTSSYREVRVTVKDANNQSRTALGGYMGDDLPKIITYSPVPEHFELGKNYPNPFNPTTTIKYSLPQAGNVKLEIYNIIGQKVRTLINEYKSEGYYDAVWNGLNDAGNQIASGVYFYRLEITKENSVLFRDLQKMLLLK